MSKAKSMWLKSSIAILMITLVLVSLYYDYFYYIAIILLGVGALEFCMLNTSKYLPAFVSFLAVAKLLKSALASVKENITPMLEAGNNIDASFFYTSSLKFYIPIGIFVYAIVCISIYVWHKLAKAKDIEPRSKEIKVKEVVAKKNYSNLYWKIFFHLTYLYIFGLSFIALHYCQLKQTYLVLLFAMGSAWVCDSAGYLIGKPFGYIKMFKYISPNKSAQGTFAGMLALGIYVSIWYYFIFDENIKAFIMHDRGSEVAALLQFTLFLLGLSVFGDLFQSMVKRLANKKDSASLIPEHGGIFDRIDSLLFTVPYTIFALSIVGQDFSIISSVASSSILLLVLFSIELKKNVY